MTEQAIPAGMKSWAGGDSAPADWDGGYVLLRYGGIGTAGTSPSNWQHVRAASRADIIAYTPRADEQNVKNSALLPCPFCGGDDSTENAVQEAAVILTSFSAASGGRAYRVECCCGVRGSSQRLSRDAITAWNTRPALPDREAVERVVHEAIVRWSNGDQPKPLKAMIADAILRLSPAGVVSEVSQDTVAFIQSWLMNADYNPTQFDRDFAAAIDARTITMTAATLAERFCAAALPDTVSADMVAIKPMPGRMGTNLMTVAEATAMFSAMLSASPAQDGEGALGEYPLAPMDGVAPIFVRQMMLQAMALEYAKATGASIHDMMPAARATWDTDWETDPEPRTIDAAIVAAQSDLEHWGDDA